MAKRLGHKQIALAIAKYLEDSGIDVGRKHAWFAGKKGNADPRALKRVLNCSNGKTTKFEEADIACRIGISSAPYRKGEAYDSDTDENTEDNTIYGNVTVYYPTLEVVVDIYEGDSDASRSERRAFKKHVEALIGAIRT